MGTDATHCIPTSPLRLPYVVCFLCDPSTPIPGIVSEIDIGVDRKRGPTKAPVVTSIRFQEFGDQGDRIVPATLGIAVYGLP